MNKLIGFIIAVFVLVSCGTDKPKVGPDYGLVKPELKLSKQQEKQFDQITLKYSKLRHEAFTNARAGGKMNREAMMADMKRLFGAQAKELKPVLSEEQFELYAHWLEEQLPGRVGWSPELISQIKDSLSLDEQKALMIDAVNEAFIEAYIGTHDNYHGDNEAAKAYWIEFNENRNLALKEVLTEEEFTKFLEITKEVRFKGEHGKGK